MNIDAQEVREIIREELPQLVKTDPRIRQLILQLSKEDHPSALTPEASQDIEKKFEQRLTEILKHLKRNTEKHSKKMEESRQEIKRIKQEIGKNLEEIERIYNLLVLLDPENEFSLGKLNVMWSY